jgi:tyrosyl-tRNA synthetase
MEFLRDYGTHFTVNRMLSFDSVKLRLEREQPLTFLEFNYMLMQATDFLELNRRYGCQLQMGGSDQWGNIINGVELTAKGGPEGRLRLDHPAAVDRLWPEDGQDRGRRRLAERRRPVAL